MSDNTKALLLVFLLALVGCTSVYISIPELEEQRGQTVGELKIRTK